MTVEAVETPLGRFHVRVEENVVTAITLPGFAPPGLGRPGNMKVMAEACHQIYDYVIGHRTILSFPMQADGTDFQRRVWGALTNIPFGETRTYAEIAQQIGKPGAARAVGAANRRNPLPLVVPCHRVVSSNGLGGYAGNADGMEALKAKLLALEGVEV